MLRIKFLDGDVWTYDPIKVKMWDSNNTLVKVVKEFITANEDCSKGRKIKFGTI